MKKRIAVIIFILLVLVLCVPFYSVEKDCFALESGYGRILDEDVMLYSKNLNDEYTPLFNLFKSYYVHIIDVNSESEYYLVEYQQNGNNYRNILGYVKKNEVTLWEEPSAPYYPDVTATVINGTAPLYDNPFDLNKRFAIPAANQYKVYGSLYNNNNELFYYVIITDELDGYIPALKLDINLPPLHPDPMPTPTPAPTPSPTLSHSPEPSGGGIGGILPTDDKDGLLQIILISAICIPALIIVYLLFRPSKKIKRPYTKYYDEDDS